MISAMMDDVSDRKNRAPRVSVIIPSLDGYRNGCVPRLLESVARQTFTDYEVHVIRGVSPQGRAINQGADQARGGVLLILDDDSELADETVFQQLLDTLDSDPRIGFAGASIVVAPDATPFQKRAAAQFPRFQTPVVEGVTDSDLACHGCCAIPKAVFEEAGREREDILRGLDPDLRVRLRNAGYRIVLAPRARIYHPMPDGWKKLIRIFFRNGYGSAYARRFQPDSVYETHERLDSNGFQPRTSLAWRICRFPFRLLAALFRGRELRFAAYCSYAAGYLWGGLTARKLPETGRD
jgi:glycosyltransferase involved in cell wall biosynthesis